jgi:hypothetical protein
MILLKKRQRFLPPPQRTICTLVKILIIVNDTLGVLLRYTGKQHGNLARFELTTFWL